MSPSTWSERLDAVAGALLDHAPGCGAGERRLPSLSALEDVIGRIRVALFAEQLGPEGVNLEGRRRFVRAELDLAFASLVVEVGQEPGLTSTPAAIVEGLCDALPAIRAALLTDLQAAVDGDPAVDSPTEVLMCYPGFLAILHYRVAHELHRRGAPLVARALAEVAHGRTGVDIHPGAEIGPRCFIDHGTGVVIGATAVVGAGARLYQGVTLGARSFPVDAAGALIRGAPRHPILEDDVTVYAGASILGRVTVGRGSVIGGGVWLTRSVPAGSRILQAAVRSEPTFEGGAGI